ncbi:MAG: TlpA family protein disulfide reductase [Lentimicrobium sp.]|jgi:thiol-disulfide isomerase/thioredoxin|nr:TlpA family protein disulfide reductase [Lentimicrobium sp.]MDD2526797.1 TlpA disulfide reductase family protein [Lentimicrobiaceae bacterium]MDD4597904.1 TlpA disulfide reductase family protein [Lentimicrobiaceae bacterium]MDY0024410.1 TlpA disulfide reductase family protein [Lentimicrobium sp.]
MRNFIFVLLFLPGIAVFSQSVPIVDFEQLQPRLQLSNDTTYIVNFWATWCLPCIKEMPAFQKIHEEYISQKVKVLLVSLDFVKHIDSRLIPFIEKHELTPEVIVLNDPDANAWIDKVSPRWSGALPATLIFNKNFREFFEQEFTYLSLKQIVESNLVKQ